MAIARIAVNNAERYDTIRPDDRQTAQYLCHSPCSCTVSSVHDPQ